jgi:LuxR family transcriptional regulator, maltose regulon positive regulatory protein
MNIPLLKTKLFLPPLRPEIVVRERLLDILREAERSIVTLVCAPAGFGKSTLVSEWIHQSQCRSAWLSLDAGDNNLHRFVHYVIATIQTQESEFGKAFEDILGDETPISIEAIGTLLINELSQLTEPLYLILDDVHVITNTAIHTLIGFILDHIPPKFHLFLLTRHDPDIPLHRYRARGQLTELRANDIRFTTEEITQLFNSTLRLRLTSEQIAILEQKTEGWVAGLQMAALSLRSMVSTRSDGNRVDNFVQSFAGTDAYIIDYLMEEVLSRLDDETRNALMILSLFDDFCGDVLNAVADMDNGDTLLQRLLHDNLYVFPLDNERRWFRFHHLFRDLLAHRRDRTISNIEMYHAKAAEWFIQHDFVERGVNHIQQTHNKELIREIVIRYWKEMVAVYKPEVIHGILNILSSVVNPLQEHSPEILFLHSIVTLDNRTHDKVLKSWEYNERGLSLLGHDVEHDTISERFVRVALSLAKLSLLYHLSRFDEALVWYEETQSLFSMLPSHPHSWWFVRESSALQIMAHVYFSTGKLKDGVLLYRRIVEMFQKEHIHPNRIAEAMINCARAETSIGDISSARERLQTALDQFAPDGLVATYDNRAHALFLLARIEGDMWNMELSNELNNEALQCWEQSIWRDPAIAYSIFDEGYYHAKMRGDDKRAAMLLEKYEMMVSSGSIPLYTPRTSLYLIGSVALRINDIASAQPWAEFYARERENETHLNPSFYLFADCTYAEYLLRIGSLDEARSWAENCFNKAVSLGFNRMLASTSILLGCIYDALLQNELSEEWYIRGLEYADKYSNYSAFMNRRHCLGKSFSQLISRPKLPTLSSDFVQRLRDLLEVPSSQQSKSNRTIAISLELTQRERDTIELLAQGYSNQKIAEKLYVSLATVKTHLHNLFHKLDVSNRTEAVLKARESGLIQSDK